VSNNFKHSYNDVNYGNIHDIQFFCMITQNKVDREISFLQENALKTKVG
jgi:hypothetical protein